MPTERDFAPLAPVYLPSRWASSRALEACELRFTVFKGVTATTPEKTGVGGWDKLVAAMTNGGAPQVVPDAGKDSKHRQARYILGPLSGPREAANCLPRAFIAIDTDSASDAALGAAMGALEACGLAAVITSSISRGAPDKVGQSRCRITLPLDRPVNGAEFKDVCRVLSSRLFLGRDDPSCHVIHQLAGTWVVPKGLQGLVERCNELKGAPVAVDAVLAAYDATLPGVKGSARGVIDAILRVGSKRGSKQAEKTDLGTKPNGRKVDNSALFGPPMDIGRNRAAIAGALNALDFDLERDWWTAIKAVKGGMQQENATDEERDWLWTTFLAWASKSDKFDPDEQLKKLESSRAESVKSLFTAAKERGWVNPGEDKAQSDVILQRLNDVEMEPIVWLWDGYLARGKFHLLAGHAGVSKTTLALTLAAIVTRGGNWPDGTRAEIGNVLIWSGEDGVADTIKPRLVVNGANPARVFTIAGIRDDAGNPQPFDPATDMPALSSAAASIRGGVSLLIVDPIVSAVAGDSHKNAEVRRDLQALVDLGERLGCAVLGITHLTKGTRGARVGERITGSLAFNALARIVMGCAQMPDDDRDSGRVAFFRSKSNIGPDDGGFFYDFDQAPVPGHDAIGATKVLWRGPIQERAEEIMERSEAGADKGASKSDMARLFLMEALAKGPVKATEIVAEAAAQGISRTTLQRAESMARINVDRWGFGRGGVSWWYLPGTLPEDWDARRAEWTQSR